MRTNGQFLFTGRIVSLSSLVEGTSTKTGEPWKSIMGVIEEVDAEYPRRILVKAMNGRADELKKSYESGGVYTVSYTPKVREFDYKDGTHGVEGENFMWKIERE